MAVILFAFFILRLRFKIALFTTLVYVVPYEISLLLILDESSNIALLSVILWVIEVVCIVGGYSLERLLRAPCDGVFATVRVIGDTVAAGEVVAQVAGQPVVAQIGGVLRGMLFDGLTVKTGMKIGDIDPRCRKEHCFSISDKARAVGGGVLEALLRHDVLP
jgi:hypothetical protein